MYRNMISSQLPSHPYVKSIRTLTTTRRLLWLLIILLLFKVRERINRFRTVTLSHDPKRASPIPGFKPISDQIYIREPNSTAEDAESVPASHPDVVIIYGWGDGQPKHVAKYADGFVVLFPRAKIVLVLAPIAKALLTKNDQRADGMMPIIDAIFPRSHQDKASVPRVLAHAMSNTGGINYVGTLDAYCRLHGQAMPHQLLCLDSAPGGSELTPANVGRWSRGVALGTARWFPWSFEVTQMLMGIGVLAHSFHQTIMWRESPASWVQRIRESDRHILKDTRLLYLYSKEDDIVGHDDVEQHIADTERRGWPVDVQVFEGSGHVKHMQHFPEQYWNAILEAWNRAMGVAYDRTD